MSYLELNYQILFLIVCRECNNSLLVGKAYNTLAFFLVTMPVAYYSHEIDEFLLERKWTLFS